MGDEESVGFEVVLAKQVEVDGTSMRKVRPRSQREHPPQHEILVLFGIERVEVNVPKSLDAWLAMTSGKRLMPTSLPR